ncbi:MFS transporter, DHA2 family, multidrug resistance protein [Prauserella marina]|uniref:MFS transporter, DHA2 family, multidrug resistance protein n=2 Tax=Prauserella marina TaxID=530584 RepID=A0A1G6JNH7_9PSEU|nr:DHA2 family multidrug resistance protein-like MFS transporter [Prauserella marina]SDC20274.1 MFS transporter, DHA2 family, multidrug resistance protein [Prauserella marina]
MNGARRWTLLATVAAGLLLITVDNTILYTALPTLTKELGAGSSESLWIINAYPLVMAGLLLGAGTLGDRIGHRRMFLTGLVVFGAASVMAAFSPNPATLIASRGVLAVGAAAMMPATLALIRITFTDQRERNMAVAVWGSVSIVGGALGPIIGGVLLRYFWWGSVFLVNVPVVIVAFVATLIVAPRGVPDRSQRWDLVSSVQAMAGLAGLVMAIKEAANAETSWLVLAGSLVVAVTGFLLFARRQHRLPYPLLAFSIFRNAAFSSGVIAAGVSMFAIAGIQLATTQRFQLIAGFTPLEAGLLVAAVAAGSLPTALLGGAILHRTGLRPLISGGLAISVVGAGVTVLGLGAGVHWTAIGLALTGAGLGLPMSVASSAIIGNVPVHRAGMASSVEEVSYEFGSLTAVALLGSLLTGIAASAGFDTGYVVVMLVAGGVLAAAAVLTRVMLGGRALASVGH